MRIVFDIPSMRPGCALLQAAYGCGTSIAHRFPVKSWLLAPTDTMRVYEITQAQLEQLVRRVTQQR